MSFTFSNPLSSSLTELPLQKYFTDANHFTDIPPIDQIQTAINTSLPIQDRPTRKLLQREQFANTTDTDAFLALLNGGSFRSAAQLARARLVNRPKDVDEICRFWFVRFVCMARLKCWDQIAYEMDRIGIFLEKSLDPAESVPKKWGGKWYFEDYPELFGDRAGSMVSFELRVMHALWPSYRNDPQDSINRLYSLVCKCRNEAATKEVDTSLDINSTRFWSGDSFLLWRLREFGLHLHITVCLVEMKDFSLASNILKSIVSGMSSLVAINPSLYKFSTFYQDINSTIGRCFLQLGDIESARTTFEELEQYLSGERDTSKVILKARQTSGPARQTEIEVKPKTETPARFMDFPQLLLNRGLLLLAIGDFEESTSYFTALLTVHPSLTAVNNLAVSQLYTGNVGQAISYLESSVVENPGVAGVDEGLIFNLCTMYDLADSSVEKKRRMLAGVVGKYGGDAFDVSCLKL